MALSGLGRIAAKPSGGVVSVGLIPAGDFSAAVYDPAEDRFTSVETASPFAFYTFREDRAGYTEEAVAEEGEPLVRHTLTMELPAGPQTREAVDRLTEASAGGFVAVIALGTGEKLLAGYSPRFGSAYPLRIDRVSFAPGARPSDFPVVTVTLSGEDTQYSKQLLD